MQQMTEQPDVFDHVECIGAGSSADIGERGMVIAVLGAAYESLRIILDGSEEPIEESSQFWQKAQ